MLDMKYREKYLDLIDVALAMLRESHSMPLVTAIFHAEDLLVTDADKSAYQHGFTLRRWINKSLRASVRDHEKGESALIREFLIARGHKHVDLDAYRQAWAEHIRDRLRVWK